MVINPTYYPNCNSCGLNGHCINVCRILQKLEEQKEFELFLNDLDHFVCDGVKILDDESKLYTKSKKHDVSIQPQSKMGKKILKMVKNRRNLIEDTNKN